MSCRTLPFCLVESSTRNPSQGSASGRTPTLISILATRSESRSFTAFLGRQGLRGHVTRSLRESMGSEPSHTPTTLPKWRPWSPARQEIQGAAAIAVEPITTARSVNFLDVPLPRSCLCDRLAAHERGPVGADAMLPGRVVL
jgi:hypothetical protein